MSKNMIIALVICIVLGLLSCAVLGEYGGSSSLFDDLLGAVGAAVSGQPEKIQQIAFQRVQREAGYEALRVVLKEANVGGADYFVEALRAFIDEKDYGKAYAAYLKGLEASCVENARVIIELYYTAAVAIRLTSPEVSSELQSFIDYMTKEFSSNRAVAEMEAEGPPIEYSSPERTWETFMVALQQGNWQPVIKALIGYVPKGVDLNLIEDNAEVQDLKTNIDKGKSSIAHLSYTVGRKKDINSAVAALEINVTSGKDRESFWAVFEEYKGAWKLVGMLKDISLLKS